MKECDEKFPTGNCDHLSAIHGTPMVAAVTTMTEKLSGVKYTLQSMRESGLRKKGTRALRSARAKGKMSEFGLSNLKNRSNTKRALHFSARRLGRVPFFR